MRQQQQQQQQQTSSTVSRQALLYWATYSTVPHTVLPLTLPVERFVIDILLFHRGSSRIHSINLIVLPLLREDFSVASIVSECL